MASIQELDSADTDPPSATSSLTIQDRLRASSVKRWHIVSTRKRQSLAEHSFNVAHIAMAILDELSSLVHWGGPVCVIAMNHDIDEVLTGDMPTPAKNKAGYRFDVALSPAVIVKMADIIDAYTFIKLNAVDRHGDEVIKYVSITYHKMVKDSPMRTANAIEKVTRDILTGDMEI